MLVGSAPGRCVPLTTPEVGWGVVRDGLQDRRRIVVGCGCEAEHASQVVVVDAGSPQQPADRGGGLEQATFDEARGRGLGEAAPSTPWREWSASMNSSLSRQTAASSYTACDSARSARCDSATTSCSITWAAPGCAEPRHAKSLHPRQRQPFAPGPMPGAALPVGEGVVWVALPDENLGRVAQDAARFGPGARPHVPGVSRAGRPPPPANLRPSPTAEYHLRARQPAPPHPGARPASRSDAACRPAQPAGLIGLLARADNDAGVHIVPGAEGHPRDLAVDGIGVLRHGRPAPRRDATPGSTPPAWQRSADGPSTRMGCGARCGCCADTPRRGSASA